MRDLKIIKEVTIGDCRLILGDMREVLPRLSERADMVLSDPPYRLTSGGSSTGEMGGIFSKDRYDNSGELFDMVEWSDMAPLIYDACSENADAIIMSSDREEARARICFEDAGFGFHRLLMWNKGTVTPNKYFMQPVEFGIYMWKGRARTINNPGHKALVRYPNRDVSHLFLDPKTPKSERHAHATEKPVAVMESWMRNCTDSGDLVLDPFMGSGSTIVAAAKAGRRAIGIEKDPKWFEVACARVREAYNRPSLF